MKSSEVFKERLKYSIKRIWNELIIPSIAVIVMCFLICVFGIWLPGVGKVILIIILGTLALVMLLALISFLYWLFIEPFKKIEK